MPPFADPKFWTEYGIAGLVILALFIILWWLLNAFKKLYSDSMNRFEKLASEHKAERKEWRDDMISGQERRDAALRESLNNFTAELRHSRK